MIVEQTYEERTIMNFWTMIVMIVAICVAKDIIKSRYNIVLNESEKSNQDVSKLLSHLENRVENLETIVLEAERNRRFVEIDQCRVTSQMSSGRTGQ